MNQNYLPKIEDAKQCLPGQCDCKLYISCISIVVPNTGTTNTGTQILVRKLCKELEVLIYIESDLMSFSLRR